MPNTKLHPSIVIYRNADNTEYRAGDHIIPADDVVQVSNEMWTLTLTAPAKPVRRPRSDEWEW